MKRMSGAFSDQSGFTLTEAIFSLFLMASVLSLLPLFYYSYSAIDRSVSLEEDYEWNIFIIQFRKELSTMDMVRSGSNERIYMERGTIHVKYERYGMVIRRQVGELGHEVVLQNVKQMTVREETPMLRLTVEFMDGNIRQATFRLPVREEGYP